MGGGNFRNYNFLSAQRQGMEIVGEESNSSMISRSDYQSLINEGRNKGDLGATNLSSQDPNKNPSNNKNLVFD